MKKMTLVLAICFSAALAVKSEAQRSNAYIAALPVTKTPLTLSADTAYATVVVDNTVVGVEIMGTKSSGTVSGKIYLVGIDLKGTNQTKIDSVTISNITGDQFKKIDIPFRTSYPSYLVQFYSTGGSWVPAAYTIRKPVN